MTNFSQNDRSTFACQGIWCFTCLDARTLVTEVWRVGIQFFAVSLLFSVSLGNWEDFSQPKKLLRSQVSGWTFFFVTDSFQRCQFCEVFESIWSPPRRKKKTRSVEKECPNLDSRITLGPFHVNEPPYATEPLFWVMELKIIENPGVVVQYQELMQFIYFLSDASLLVRLP